MIGKSCFPYFFFIIQYLTCPQITWSIMVTKAPVILHLLSFIVSLNSFFISFHLKTLCLYFLCLLSADWKRDCVHAIEASAILTICNKTVILTLFENKNFSLKLEGICWILLTDINIFYVFTFISRKYDICAFCILSYVCLRGFLWYNSSNISL